MANPREDPREVKGFKLREPVVVILSSDGFKRQAALAKHANPAGVFTSLDHNTFVPTSYIDIDLFRTPVANGSSETYEDLIPFALEHEMVEVRITAQNLIRMGPLLANVGSLAHGIALLEEMKSAHRAGKLNKAVQFHELILGIILADSRESGSSEFGDIQYNEELDLLRRAARQASRI